jgi:RHS repeat-associated protein
MKNDGVGIAEGTGDMIAEIIGTDSDNAKAVFSLSNHRGDTLALVDQSGNVVGTYEYDAWGNVISHTGQHAYFTFSTKHYYENASLYYYGYRWYDPQAKRWTQPDPEGLSEGLDLYRFCGNCPICAVDLQGREQHNFLCPSDGIFYSTADQNVKCPTLTHAQLLSLSVCKLVERLSLPNANIGTYSYISTIRHITTYTTLDLSGCYVDGDSWVTYYERGPVTVSLSDGIVTEAGVLVQRREINYHLTGLATAAGGVPLEIGLTGVLANKIRWGLWIDPDRPKLTLPSIMTLRFYIMGRSDFNRLLRSPSEAAGGLSSVQ